MPVRRKASIKTKVHPAGAIPAPFPGFIAPQLATLNDKVPPGERWVHEIKFDGYRMQGHVVDGEASMWTRGGLDWTGKFGAIPQALAGLGRKSLIVDGEVVVQDAAVWRPAARSNNGVEPLYCTCRHVNHSY